MSARAVPPLILPVEQVGLRSQNPVVSSNGTLFAQSTGLELRSQEVKVIFEPLKRAVFVPEPKLVLSIRPDLATLNLKMLQHFIEILPKTLVLLETQTLHSRFYTLDEGLEESLASLKNSVCQSVVVDATEIPHISLSKRISFLLDKETEGSEELGVEGAELLGELE